jgi:hypothetical protein
VVDMQWECIHTCGVSLGFDVLSVIRSAEKRRLHYQEKAAKWILQDRRRRVVGCWCVSEECLRQEVSAIVVACLE